MKKEKIQRYVFLILILFTFSLFLYYFFSPQSNNSLEYFNESSNELINIVPTNIQTKTSKQKNYQENQNVSDETQENIKRNDNILKTSEPKNKKLSCPACNFTPLYPPSSTRRDVVLTAALNRLKRVEAFLRTLRMTGSRCRIILFLDNKNTVEPHFLRFFKSCDIEPVFVNNNNNSVLIGGSKMTRYYYYQQWLSLHINEVDRVLHSDAFDVIFQSDPFREEMLPMTKNNKIDDNSKNNPKLLAEFKTENKTSNQKQENYKQEKDQKLTQKEDIEQFQQNNQTEVQHNNYITNKDNNTENILYFTFEPVSLGNSKWTASWFSRCYGSKTLHKYQEKPVSCSGVTIGYAKAFLTYLNIMLGQNSWHKCFGDSLDQAHHNYILYNGDLKKAGLKIKSLDCNSKFLTMHFCCKKGKCYYNNQTNIVYGNNTSNPPILVHQYNRWKNLTKRNKIYCPGSASDLFPSKKNNADNNTFEMAEIERLPPLKVILPDKLM